MIDGLKRYIEWSMDFGLEVYMGTILPIYGWRTYEPFRDDLRNEVNEWIRTTSEIKGCIDFDKAVRDNINVAAFGNGFDSGDHLHPSEAAYKEMAKTVPVELLKYI